MGKNVKIKLQAPTLTSSLPLTYSSLNCEGEACIRRGLYKERLVYHQQQYAASTAAAAYSKTQLSLPLSFSPCSTLVPDIERLLPLGAVKVALGHRFRPVQPRARSQERRRPHLIPCVV